MNNPNKNINKKIFNPSYTLGFIDGLDISFFLSLLPFISYYYFNELKDNDYLFFSLAIIMSSYFIRPFALKIFVILKTISKNKNFLNFKHCFVFCLPFLYFLIFLIPSFDNLFLINITILFFIRISIGIIFALNYSFLNNYDIKNPSYMNVKKFIFKFLGIMFGLLLVEFLNQIFSNNELNSWYWKLSLLVLILFSFIYFFIFKNSEEKNSLINTKSDFSELKIDFTSLTKLFLENLFFTLPLIFLMIIMLQSWLPGIVRPENAFFIQFKLSHVFLFILLTFCLHFIFQLIGKDKIVTYFSIFNILLCIIYYFFVEISSSYGINFFQFYLSVISACALPLSFHLRNKNVKQLFIGYNLFYMFNSALIMGFVYYLMYYELNYSLIFIFIFIIFTLNTVFKRLKLN